MEILTSLASEISQERRVLPSGRDVEIEAYSISFPTADPSKLPVDATFFGTSEKIPDSYLIKPLVIFNDEPLFGELAVACALKEDGWNAVWVDSYHSKGEKRLFWKDLPDRSRPVVLARESTNASRLYEKIRDRNRGVGGFFDVMAWKGSSYLFVEYKGKGDGANKNELRWIDAVLSSGLKVNDLRFVLHPKKRR
jgi:hypothetical protein